MRIYMLLFICLSNFIIVGANVQQIKLERPTLEDLPAVKELMRIVWFDTYTKFYSTHVVQQVTDDQTLDYLQEQLENPNIVFIVARTYERQIIGVVTSERKTEELVEGIRLYVHPDYRSQGLGAALINESVKYYPGVKVFRINVKEANIRAIAFYEKFGFIVVDKADHTLFGETAVNLILEKRIG